MKYKVVDMHDGYELSVTEILEEVNRDRTMEWQDYTFLDLELYESEVLDWVDRKYYEVTLR